MHLRAIAPTDDAADNRVTSTLSTVSYASVTLSGAERRGLQHHILESSDLTLRERRLLLDQIRQAEADTRAWILDDGVLLDDLRHALLDHTLRSPGLQPNRHELMAEPVPSVGRCIVRLHASVLWWRRTRIWALGSEQTRKSIADVIAAHRVEARPCNVKFDASGLNALRLITPQLPTDVRKLMGLLIHTGDDYVATSEESEP